MNKGKIVLFYPKPEKYSNNMHLPLPVLVLASDLLNNGYTVEIIDERKQPHYRNRLVENIKEAVLFGVSSMTGYQIKGGLTASRLVKSIDRDKPIVWGGWHASILPEESLQSPEIDIAVIGPGEDILLQISQRLFQKTNLDGIPAIAYKDNGKILKNPQRTTGKMQTISKEALTLIEMPSYIQNTELGSRSIFWVSSRGCPYNCGFCCSQHIYERKWVGIEAEKVVEDAKWLVEEYNINGINFVDTNFFVNKERVALIAEGLVKEGLNIHWATSVRVDQVNLFDQKFLALLKRSGCNKLFIGAESGSKGALEFIDKNIDIDDVLKMADLLDRNGIIAELFFMAGFPLEPEEELNETLKLIGKIKKMHPNHQITSFIYTPYPGTTLFDVALKHGFTVPSSIEEWVNWDILDTQAPWIRSRGYGERLHSFAKMYYPLAFPSDNLKDKFKKPSLGWLYWLLHKLAACRIKSNCFIFPIEWKIAKFILKTKERYKLFSNLGGFR